MSKIKQDKLYLYNRHIADAKLDGLAKGLLYFYANVYNWSKDEASYWSQRSICASVGISQNTYQKKRKYLEELGWLKVQNRGRNKSCKVWVSVGIDDPDYDQRCWASGHKRMFNQDELENLFAPVHNPFDSLNGLDGIPGDLIKSSVSTGTTNITTERNTNNSFYKGINDDFTSW